jgi:tricorn protease
MQSVRNCLTVILLCLALAPVCAAGEAHLPRHPAPSPDGASLAFSWQGDIWLAPITGGQARRLTIHPGTDRFPVWSRDGQWIAFSSDRNGNEDVFLLPLDGSAAPKELTFASAGDRPVDFTPDGTGVVFASRRFESIRRGSMFYTVPVTGGTPERLMTALGNAGGWSPDGQRWLFSRGGTMWSRRGYRGAANRDLWLWEGGEAFRQLTDFDGDDDAGSWVDDQTVVLRSARSGRKNLYRLDLGSGALEQLTRHEGSDVRWPRAAGGVVAYEFEDGIWTVPVAGGEPRRISLEVPVDFLANRVERRADSDGASELAVSPDGKLAAFLVHGDVFLTAVVPKEEAEIAPPLTVQLTDTPQSESGLTWTPDGKALLVSSLTTGAGDLYRIRPKDEKTPWIESFEFTFERLTDHPQRDHSPRVSPDGERIAFLRDKGELIVRPLDGGAEGEHTLFKSWDTPDFRWSPDGQWMAYALNDEDYNSEIWIQGVDGQGGGEPYNVSRHPDDDVAPRWSPDGRRLVWTTLRHAQTFDVWSVWLSREDHERTPRGWLKLWQEEKEKKDKPAKKEEETDEAEKGGKKGKSGKNAKPDAATDEAEKKKELPKVQIDFDTLWRRSTALTALLGNEEAPVVSADGKTILFTAAPDDERDLYSVRWDGEEVTRLTEGDTQPTAVQIVEDNVFYLHKRGTVQRIDMKGKAGDPVPFTARYAVDRREEAAAVFDEVWQLLSEFFYDPAFHGVDWPAQREKYRPWALAASEPEDFADAVNLMLGELNASHMGYYQPDKEEGEESGWIGVTYDPQQGGPGLSIREVLPESPAARLDVALQPGERILAVAGQPVSATTNIYSLFVGTVGQRVPLRVQGAEGGAERTVVVEPVGGRQIGQLRYQQWVRERQGWVEELSGGRLGYLHIQGMVMPSFEEFERDLQAAAHGKEGLIIDVRSNGGGWTTDYLMAVLSVQRHARTVPRDGDPSIAAYPQSRLPLAAWTRPALTLCDEESYSNAEIFSHAFKTLKRGLVVGNTTFGAVISTGGSPLLNGAFVRLPGRGWFVAGSGVNMERQGAVPDVIVLRPPQEDAGGQEDSQLRRGVEVFLENLESDPRYGAW